MKTSALQTVSKIFSFVLVIGLELWILSEAYLLYTNEVTSDYSANELFWLFLLVMIAPVLPQITFYTKNKFGALAFHIITITVFTFLIILEPLFIPSLSILEVAVILLYAYVATGVNYLNHRNNLAKHTKTEVAYTSFRIIAFFIAVYAGTYFGNQDSFSANYLIYILITIPLFIMFAISILINFELKSHKE